MTRLLKSLSLLVCITLAGCVGEPISGLTDSQDSISHGQTSVAKGAVSISQIEVGPFQPAGAVGGGVLTPGTFHPPTKGSKSTLRRYSDSLKMNIHTTGLPPGAFTVWWIVFNVPSECSGGCGEDDFFTPAVMTSAFLMDGKVVRKNGVGNFQSSVAVGDYLGTPGSQHIMGPGLLDPTGAEVHFAIKYHGPASDDPATLEEQLSTILGSCDLGANALDLGPPFGVQCFDPQGGAHLP